LTLDRPAAGNRWYAVWTHSHCERLVNDHLSARGFTVFLPEVPTWSKRGGVKRLVETPLFPGYLFVHHAIDKHSYIEMLKVRGVVRILEGGWAKLTPIPDEEIDAVQRITAAGVPVRPYPSLAEGSRVRVTDGPLAGLEGVFVQDKPTRGRLIASVGLLGRSVAVEIDVTSIAGVS
jgi:transcription antitermination factor NusG